MSSRSAVGAACPYCHFTIKSGVELTFCDACGSPHHAECWAENEGCAVTGCASYAGPAGAAPTPTPPARTPTPPAPVPPAGAEDTAETQALPQSGQAPLRPRTPNAPAWAPPSGGPRTPHPPQQQAPAQGWGSAPPQTPAGGGSAGDGGRGRWIALGAVIPLVLILAVVIGYLIASPGDDKKDDKGDRAAQVTKTDGRGDGAKDGTGTAPTPPSNGSRTGTGGTPSTGGGSAGGGGAGAGTPPAGQTAAQQKAAKKKAVATQLVAIMQQSARGRQMTVGQQYQSALTNRRAVARKLAALEPADGAQRSAIASFQAAMRSSESAIGAHSANPSIGLTQYDRDASYHKGVYCQKWSSSGMAASTGQGCDPNGI